MADDDVTAPDEQETFATEQERQLEQAHRVLYDAATSLCAIRTLAISASCMIGANQEAEAILTAIQDMARLHARRLDRAITVYGGGAPAIGCFNDDLAAE